MACKSPALPLYAAEFLHDRKLRRLPLEVEVVVVRLWAMLWVEGPATRDELLEVSVLLRCTEATLDAALASGLFVCVEGRWTSARLEQEREERESIRSSRAKAGARGNLSRWGDRNVRSQAAIANDHRKLRSQEVIATPTHPPTHPKEEEEEGRYGAVPSQDNGGGASTAVRRARWGVPPKRKAGEA